MSYWLKARMLEVMTLLELIIPSETVLLEEILQSFLDCVVFETKARMNVHTFVNAYITIWSTSSSF